LSATFPLWNARHDDASGNLGGRERDEGANVGISPNAIYDYSNIASIYVR
jgi:hypothetical protein